MSPLAQMLADVGREFQRRAPQLDTVPATLAGNALVLMPCGGQKLDTPAPAIELYRGPMWQTLRQHRGAIPHDNVFVLSARYGLVGADTVLAPYDARLSAALADASVKAGIYRSIARGVTPFQAIGRTFHTAAGLVHPPYAAVINAGAGHYRRVLDAYVAGLRAAGVIALDAPLAHVDGGIGEQRAQLGRWLREINAAS